MVFESSTLVATSDSAVKTTRFLQSQYTVLVELKGDRVLAYNSLSGGLAVWEAPEHALYQGLGDNDCLNPLDPIVQNLLRGGYIVHEETDELAILEQQYRTHRFDPNTMILTIAPTLACNFACDYCFQGQDKAKDMMSAAVQDAIVALVERAAPNIKHLHIAWYGGEPLVGRKIIESLSTRFIALCDRQGIRYDAMIVTNGYLLTVEVARSLYTHRVKQVQITLDGLPEYHDTRRILLTGKGTFEQITDNIKQWIDEMPLTVSVRVNIDERNQDSIHGLIDHLVSIGLAGKKNLKLYFAPVEAMTEGCHVIADVTLKKSLYSQLETELYQHGFEAGLTALPYPPRFRGTCAAVRPKGFVVVPNGDVHKCWDTVSWAEKRVGTIFDIDALIRDERSLRWLRWTPFENQTCRNCKLLPSCAGACAYKFVNAHETRGEAAILPCPSWKYSIKERLILTAEKSSYITADDYDPLAIQTDPNELCADVHLEGGQELPEPMQALLAQMKAN